MAHSQNIVLESPMSFTGSWKRITRLVRPGATWWLLLLQVAAVALALMLAWTVILGWYCTWGLLLLPYRFMRRGQRRERLAAQRHAEMMRALGDRR